MKMALEGITHFIFTSSIALKFVVNNAFESVPITFTVAPPADFLEPTTKEFFEYADNVLIESVWIRFPHCFTGGDVPPIVSLGYMDKNLNTGSFDQFGNLGILTVPFNDQEFTINNALQAPGNIDSDYKVLLNGFAGDVSMFNVPDDLNGKDFNPQVFLKVRHTLPMKF